MAPHPGTCPNKTRTLPFYTHTTLSSQLPHSTLHPIFCVYLSGDIHACLHNRIRCEATKELTKFCFLLGLILPGISCSLQREESRFAGALECRAVFESELSICSPTVTSALTTRHLNMLLYKASLNNLRNRPRSSGGSQYLVE
jgi:hypothetical protein